MKHLKYFKIFLFVILTSLLSGFIFAQTSKIGPDTLNQQIPNFTLPVFGGGEISLSKLKGKNVLLIFLRGLVTPDHWCNIDNYQYAEIADLEKNQQIRKKYNLEILFVMPYNQETVKSWPDKFPEQLADIEKWKYPAEPEKQTEKQKNWTDATKKLFPKKFGVKKGYMPLPVLIDSERTLSKGLGIFSTDWDHSRVEQNIPSVYLIDKTGKVRFKYTSQNTFDRPDCGSIISYIRKMLKKKK